MALQQKGFSQNSLRYQRGWLLHPVNSFFVVISTFTLMLTQMQTPNNSLIFFFCWYVIPYTAHREHTLELVVEMWKSRLCCEMRPNIGGSCMGAFWPWVSSGIVGWRLSIRFGCRYNARLSKWKPSPDCPRVTNSERTRQCIQLRHQICSFEAKCSGLCVITTSLALRV